jgi:nascent polypeptide-associated complex subunit alpha
MFGGGGGMNPRKLQQMMEQFGIDVEEMDASRVVIETGDGDIVFEDPEVTKMEARGTETYQVVGDPERQETAAIETDDGDEDEADAPSIPDDDVELVAMRTGASEEAARDALRATDGDLAAAIDNLE